MGCSSSQPALDSDDIYGVAMSNAPEGIEWKESQYKFSDDDSKEGSVDKKLMANTRNVVSWVPSGGKPISGIVLIAHGLFAHAQTHSREALEFAKEGFAVYAIDHVGHGISSGERARINSWQELRDDYIAFAGTVQALHPVNTPVLLYGHSMGCLVTAHAAAGISNVKAIIFSGFPLVAGPGAASIFGCRCLYPISRLSCIAKVGACMAVLDPKGPTAPVILEAITSNKEMLEKFKTDPRRYHGWLMNVSSAQLLAMIDKLKYGQALKDIKVPVLLVHGVDDEIAYPAGSELAHALLGTPTEQKQLTLLPGLMHEFYNEVEPKASEAVEKIITYAKEQMDTAVAVAATDVAVKVEESTARRLVPA